MTAEQFRRIALSMEGAIEGAHMGHPDFRANGRIFATLSPGEKDGMVKLSPEQQEEYLHAHPKAYVPVNGAWGRQGCTTVRLAAATEATLTVAMRLAWLESGKKRPAKKSRWNRSL